LAVAGVYTTNKTYGLGFGGSLNLADDRYRLTFLTGAARARYEFFGIGSGAGSAGQPVWLSQHGHAVFLQGLRQIGWRIFIGPRFSHRTIKAGHETTLPPEVSAELPQLPAISDQLNLSLTTAAMGFRVERDTRDDMFYPTRGARMDARIDFFGPYVGSKFTFQNYVFEMNKYLPVRKRSVVALRAMGCGVSGDRIPFYELCQFGMMGDLRGYQAGRYRDRAMFATQGEWRVILPWRFGATAFAGVGEVAPDGGSFTFEDLLSSGGAGLRFNLSKQRRINLRLDLAYSRTGASWSMGVAELF
jgi:outer membrane protein assembly factor BamA